MKEYRISGGRGSGTAPDNAIMLYMTHSLPKPMFKSTLIKSTTHLVVDA